MTELLNGRDNCMSEDCDEMSIKFCTTCRQAFCLTHDQAHTELLKGLKVQHEVITIEEHQSNERGENFHNCTQHQNASRLVACRYCNEQICVKCNDDSSLMKDLTGRHNPYNLNNGETSDVIGELKKKEMMISEGMKERRQLFENLLGEHQIDLRKLAAKAEELHTLINNYHLESKEKLVEHISKKKEQMDELEVEFNKFQKKCQKIYDQAYISREQHEAMDGKDLSKIKMEAEAVMSFELDDDPERFTKLSLKVTGGSLKFPISFQTEPLFNRPGTIIVPTSLELKHEISTPSDSCCVHFSQAGHLVHSVNSKLSGLDFNPALQSLKNSYNVSLFEHKSSLYILQYNNGYYHVHEINLKNRSVSKSIISFPSIFYYYQHMSVTDTYIFIANGGSDTVKVYLKTNNKHMCDIKHGDIKEPKGMGVLGDTLLIGNCGSMKIINIAISKKIPEPKELRNIHTHTREIVVPEIGCDVKWTTDLVGEPYSIQVNEGSPIILVGCNNKNRIEILTYQGEKLSTLDVPMLTYIYDLSVFGNQLAIAGSSGVNVYEMKY